jgi:hypothetical protein
MYYCHYFQMLNFHIFIIPSKSSAYKGKDKSSTHSRNVSFKCQAQSRSLPFPQKSVLLSHIDSKVVKMAFTQYKQLADVLKKYQIRYEERPWKSGKRTRVPNDLKADIKFTMEEVVYDNSEAAICENLIYPVLKTVWKAHSKTLALWSHQPIGEGDLSGVPDYVISKKSPLGKIVFESPFVAVVEAKKDDFTSGWAQCGLEMYVMQSLNQDKTLPVHGIVSNGETWEIARLDEAIFTKYQNVFLIERLDDLYSAISDVFTTYQGKI